MPPKPKDAKKGLFKVGTPLKDIIPPTLKQPIREGKPAKIPEFTPTNIVINPYQPQPEFEEWPGDDAALNFDFGLETQAGNYFVDSAKISVPPSFRSNENQIIFWRRPKELVRSEAAHEQKYPSGYVASENQLLRHKTVDIVDDLNEGGSIDIPEESGASPFEKEEPEVQMFQTIERQETQEEAEQRVKEQIEKQQQLEKGKKKPTKKEEPIDNTPQKIKDVILSDICLKEEIPAYSKWIASQLQIIKDKNLRDVHTKKPIWTKVYPQREGIPVYNPHGRYWVKLYHNGKEKKIEIDDKIPVIYGKSLFAKSANNNEIWPYIIAKALIKLNSPKWQDETAKEVEVGDGSIIYALTGYLPETINLGNNLQGKWKTIADFLGDKKYALQEQHITCFCLPDFKPTAASLKPKNGSDSKGNKSLRKEATSPRSQSDTSRASAPSKIGLENNESKKDNPAVIFKRREQVSLTTINTKLEKVKTSADAPEHSTGIIPGFAYSIIDLFENENFNMVYVLKRTENDLKLRTDFFNLQKVNLNKMTKEEKLEHRRIKKELKEKIYEEDNRRFELIKKPAIHYKLMKIKSSIHKAASLNFNCPFDQEDIGLAKKCILNKLSKPPNYDMYDLKMDDKSVSSAQFVLEHNKVLPLDDFSRMESAKDPLKRDPDGTWLSNQDFEGCFQYIQIFHDPTKFKYRESFPVVARPEEEQVNYDDKEVIVIEGEEEEKDSSSPSLNGPVSTSFLYSFASTRSPNMIIEPKPLMVLQKFDFQNFEVANTYKTLNQMHDSDQLILENKNQIFRIQIVSPLTSYLWILSNLHFKLMSFAEFLSVYEGYQTKSQQIEYPIIEKNRYHSFFKGIVPPLENPETILIRIKNNSDLIMLKYIRLKIVELPDKSYTSPEDFKSGVVTSSLERNYYVTKSVPIPLEANKRYMIMIEGRMSETVNEGVLEFDVLFRNPSFALDLVEQVEPLEYVDKYVPTKYGILFRERLFLNNETQASFFVRICDILNSLPPAAAAQKGGKKVEAPALEEKELSARRTIKLELFRDNELVSYAFGQNKVIISNAILYPTNNKDEPRNYYLQASFNLREWPEGKEVNEDTCNLHWILKVASSDTIAIFRDTQKEDNIKAIKKSWEDKEPGRLEKAKIARKKFMIIEKQKRGEPLDNDEIQLLNEPRQRKTKEEEVKKDSKGKPQPKPKAPVGKGKKEEAPVEEKKEERPLPKSENHVMDQIGQFLVHMEQPRLLFEEADEEGAEYVRTDEEKDELREKILLGKEEAYGMYERNKRAKDKIKEITSDNRDKIVKDLQAMRDQMKEKLAGLMKERDAFRKGDKEIKDKERAIINLCKQEKPVYDDVVKCLNENSTNDQIDPALIKILEKVKKNVYITEKVEKLNTALTLYDLPTLTTVLQEIRDEGIEANPELLEKADELIDMAEKNPTFIADKQKEAQKALKGKKK